MQQQNRFDPSLIVSHSVCVHTFCCVRRVNLTLNVLDDPGICFNVRADLWCGCCISGVPDIDQIALFADTATVEEVLRAVAKEQSYTEEDVQQVLEMLQAKWVRTVGNLASPPAAAQQPTPELTDDEKDSKIARLKRLFDAGSITKEQYDSGVAKNT